MSKIAFIFPGQGAQKVGMGKEFFDSYETAKRVFEEANAVLDVDVEKICFEENQEINQTEYTQCAMVTTSLAIMAVLKEQGLKPSAAAGLSLGEYCALAAAGVMSEADAVRVVRKRGILMEHEVPAGQGAMAAVLAMEADKIENVIAPIDGVQIANYNCPGQIVISGEKSAVETAAAALKDAGAKRVIMLNVSGPFHSKMLKGAGEKLGEVLKDIELSPMEIPYAANVTGQYVTDINDVKKLLTEQVYSSVRWQQDVETMIADGVDVFIEIGPGKTLSGFVKKINSDVKAYNIETPADMEAVLSALKEA